MRELAGEHYSPYIVRSVLHRSFVFSLCVGISACLLCLAAHHCGLDKMAVYDGSWQEWYNRAQQKHKMLQPTEE